MQVIASVLGEKKAIENKHEKASTGVQVNLQQENATRYLPGLDFKRMNKRVGKLPAGPFHNPQFRPQSEVSVKVRLGS